MMTTKDLSYTTGDQCPNKGHTAIWVNIPQIMDNPKLASVTNMRKSKLVRKNIFSFFYERDQNIAHKICDFGRAIMS